jgi:hypothetical protein
VSVRRQWQVIGHEDYQETRQKQPRWIRLHHGVFHSQKVSQLTHWQRWAFVAAVSLQGQHLPVTVSSVADFAEITERRSREAIRRMVEVGLLAENDENSGGSGVENGHRTRRTFVDSKRLTSCIDKEVEEKSMDSIEEPRESVAPAAPTDWPLRLAATFNRMANDTDLHGQITKRMIVSAKQVARSAAIEATLAEFDGELVHEALVSLLKSGVRSWPRLERMLYGECGVSAERSLLGGKAAGITSEDAARRFSKLARKIGAVTK